MKKIIPIFLCCALLWGCAGGETGGSTTAQPSSGQTVVYPTLVSTREEETAFVSRFDSENLIQLSDEGITVNGGSETETVYVSHDIVYYEQKTTYESGLPYGAGSEKDMHSAEEAAAHMVVNITAPGTYRISGKLSAGQIRIDLGKNADEDENAVVELILDNVDITCTVGPAILFKNVYECDGDWSEETATAEVDTAQAGAVLVLEGENSVSGSYVAKIYKDKEGQKKLYKQDGAIYSYMSMNVFGPGTLNLFAENEGLDTELHLTIYGGKINISADNDGINTNEDNVSVVTINGGQLHILAGLGEEGDGIDSNGFITINGGVVITAANPASDSGLDSDRGSFIHGGTVLALGSTMDGAESKSSQGTMNLQFSQTPTGAIVLTYPDGTVAFAYDPAADSLLADTSRRYTGATISSPNLHQGQTYYLYTGGSVAGTQEGGVYDPTTVTGYTGGTQMAYTSQGGMGFPGGMGGMGFAGGQKPDMPDGEQPSMPEGEMPSIPDGEVPSMPEGQMPTWPEGEQPSMPDGQMPTWPEGQEPSMPDGEVPSMPEGGREPGGMQQGGEASTEFTLTDTVSSFSGVTKA